MGGIQPKGPKTGKPKSAEVTYVKAHHIEDQRCYDAKSILSTMIQLYRGGQFSWWRESEYPDKTTDLTQFTHKSIHYIDICESCHSHRALYKTLQPLTSSTTSKEYFLFAEYYTNSPCDCGQYARILHMVQISYNFIG